MATLYYNAAVDSDWNTLGNWWTSDAFTTQASALPTSSDSVVLSATCDVNSGSTPTVVNLTFIVNNAQFGIWITVTGNATFEGYECLIHGQISGDVLFLLEAANWNGTVNGNATFDDYSCNNNIVTGNATFNDYSKNGLTNPLTTVNGNATFNDGSYNNGLVVGNATFNDISYNRYGINSQIFLNDKRGINGSSILGIV